MKEKRTPLKQRVPALWKKAGGWLYRSALALLAAGLIYAMIVSTIIPPQQQHTVELGTVASEDIFAPRTVENTAATEAAREAARAAVGMSYSEDAARTQSSLTALTTCFDQMQTVRIKGEAKRATPVGAVGQYGEIFLHECNDMIQGVALTEQALLGLLEMKQADFDAMKSATFTQVDNALRNGIKEDQLADQLAFIGRGLRSDEAALTEDAQRIAVEVVNSLVQANFIYDEEATENARAQAAAKVEPVMIMNGQSLVRKGDVIDQAQYDLLVTLGLLEESHSTAAFRWGIALLVVVIFAVGGKVLSGFERAIWENRTQYALLLMIALLAVTLSWLGRKVSYLLMPMVVAPMLYAVLQNRRVAYGMTGLLAVIAGLLAGEAGAPLSWEALPVMAVTLISGTLAIHMLTASAQRGTVMLCGICVSLVWLAVFSACSMMTKGIQEFLRSSLLETAIYSLAAGVGSAIVVLGSFPVWENVFRLITPMKLLELTNPNQPLLHQLLLEAPGTHHHSVVVSNLAESAAEAVGANPMLARCGAMYHDIGKLRRPNFFKENQMGMENPHDQIDAALSARILISHVLDGQELAQRYRLPKEVVRIITSHHGDTLTAYFYVKAQQESDGTVPVEEKDFRYPGPVPVTKEEAIVMLADSVEAAVRSMPNHTPEGMEEMVRRIVKGKREDGQLDTSDLTFGQLEEITQVFLSVLGGIYHERIQYPPMAKKEAK